MDSKKIGENLRRLRTEKGLTTKDVAQAIGISQQAVSAYENGERIPRDEVKLKFAGFYKKTVGSIFYAK